MKRNEIFAVSRQALFYHCPFLSVSLNEQVEAKSRKVLCKIMLRERETNESNYNTQPNIKLQISRMYFLLLSCT